jgi:orotidine-5'-phosphate decarboxylase
MRSDTGSLLYEEVILRSQKWSTRDNMMYVVGATRADKVESIRKLAPDHFFLVPGVGAQGGSVEEISKYGLNKECGLIINSARAIIYASSDTDFASEARREAMKVQVEMKALLNRFM